MSFFLNWSKKIEALFQTVNHFKEEWLLFEKWSDIWIKLI